MKCERCGAETKTFNQKAQRFIWGTFKFASALTIITDASSRYGPNTGKLVSRFTPILWRGNRSERA